MRLKEKISWLMGRVQRSLFSPLNECMDTVLTATFRQRDGRTLHVRKTTVVKAKLIRFYEHWDSVRPQSASESW